MKIRDLFELKGAKTPQSAVKEIIRRRSLSPPDSYESIAQDLNIPVGTVYNLASRNKVTKKQVNYSEDEKKTVRAGLEQNKTSNAIAQESGIPLKRVQNIINVLLKKEPLREPKKGPAFEKYLSDMGYDKENALHQAWFKVMVGIRGRYQPKLKWADGWNQLQRQNFRCALTGQAFDVSPRGSGYASRVLPGYFSISCDQKQPRGGYTADNIQWVLYAINRMKLNLSSDEFKQICSQIASHSALTESRWEIVPYASPDQPFVVPNLTAWANSIGIDPRKAHAAAISGSRTRAPSGEFFRINRADTDLGRDLGIGIVQKPQYLEPPFDPANPLHVYWHNTYKSLRARHSQNSLSLDQAWAKITGTDGSNRPAWTCAVSGIPFNLLSRPTLDTAESLEQGLDDRDRSRTRLLYAPSPDRINPGKDYSNDNVNYVLQVINVGRSNLSLDLYLKLAQMVASHGQVP